MLIIRKVLFNEKLYAKFTCIINIPVMSESEDENETDNDINMK